MKMMLKCHGKQEDSLLLYKNYTIEKTPNKFDAITSMEMCKMLLLYSY